MPVNSLVTIPKKQYREMCRNEAEVFLLREEVRRFREALEAIAQPITYLRQKAEAEGGQIDGHWAILLTQDANFYRNLAEKALKGEPP